MAHGSRRRWPGLLLLVASVALLGACVLSTSPLLYPEPIFSSRGSHLKVVVAEFRDRAWKDLKPSGDLRLRADGKTYDYSGPGKAGLADPVQASFQDLGHGFYIAQQQPGWNLSGECCNYALLFQSDDAIYAWSLGDHTRSLNDHHPLNLAPACNNAAYGTRKPLTGDIDIPFNFNFTLVAFMRACATYVMQHHVAPTLRYTLIPADP